jgi:hypothetical protein
MTSLKPKEGEVERIIKETRSRSVDGIYFDPMLGWVTPSDVHESDTTASLQEVTAALKRASDGASLSDELYDALERVLYNYQVFVRQGVRKDIAKHKGVSWYLTLLDGDERALINYQDGARAEWHNDGYADEVPLWLLISLFRRIARHKPLGDQDADETIARVGELDAAYVRTTHYASHLGGDDD